MKEYIVIYDQEGTILSQHGGDSVSLPVGVPYILLHDYEPGIEGKSPTITKVDVSMDPHRLVFEMLGEKKEYDAMTLEEYKEKRQRDNKFNLEMFLKDRPILWEDERYYGVTKEDQNEMVNTKAIYDIKHSVDPDFKLYWATPEGDKKEFTEDEFLRLMNAIIDFVYPYRQLEMLYKEAIYNASTKEELEQMPIAYMEPIDLESVKRYFGK